MKPNKKVLDTAESPYPFFRFERVCVEKSVEM